MEEKNFAIFNVVTIAIAVSALKNMNKLENRIKKLAIMICGMGLLIGMVLQIASLYMEDFSLFVGLLSSFACSGVMLKIVKEEYKE